jgi:hypothetical protein
MCKLLNHFRPFSESTLLVCTPEELLTVEKKGSGRGGLCSEQLSSIKRMKPESERNISEGDQ